VHRSKSGPLMPALGHFRRMGTVPMPAACPLRLLSRDDAASVLRFPEAPGLACRYSPLPVAVGRIPAVCQGYRQKSRKRSGASSV
jgi:hypothetical protein